MLKIGEKIDERKRPDWKEMSAVRIQIHCCGSEKPLIQPGHVELSSIFITAPQPLLYNPQKAKFLRSCTTHR